MVLDSVFKIGKYTGSSVTKEDRWYLKTSLRRRLINWITRTRYVRTMKRGCVRRLPTESLAPLEECTYRFMGRILIS